MKFYIKSIGVHDYIKENSSDLEKLGFKFKQTSRIRQTQSFWFSKIEEPKEPKEPKEPIEINSLEELIEFTNKYGACIIDYDTITINDPDRNY